MTASTPELAGSGTLLDALRRHALKGSPAVQSLRDALRPILGGVLASSFIVAAYSAARAS